MWEIDIDECQGKVMFFVENKLLQRFDTTVRKVDNKNLPFLLSDTVGFIRGYATSRFIQSTRRRFAKPFACDDISPSLKIISPR
jgi:hypothetical protein